MRNVIALLMILAFVFTGTTVFAKEKKFKKTQEVSFDGTDIDGVVRSPDGSYLVQKRGVDFVPLYEVKKQFDQNIKDSIEYLR